MRQRLRQWRSGLNTARLTSLAQRLVIAIAATVLSGGTASAQGYKYPVVPPVIYVVGQPGWDGLRTADGGKRVLTVFGTLEAAQNAAGGQPIYRIYRHTLENTPDGTAFLDEAQKQQLANKPSAIAEMVLSDAGSLEQTVLKNAKIGNDLPPGNDNWKTTGRYSTKPMEKTYEPGGGGDDRAKGVFYFPGGSSQQAADFQNLFRVHFETQPDKSVNLMRRNNAGSLMPIDTKDLYPGTLDAGTCLFVMDAEGNMYAVARDWLLGIQAMGFDYINHSSLPGGHPIAAAGHLTVHDGKLMLIDNRSGHYHPANANTVQAIDALQRKGVSKGSYRVSFGNGAMDHPGALYIGLDPDAEAKIKKGDIEADRAPPVEDGPNRKPGADADKAKPPADDAGLLKPDHETPIPALESSKNAAAPDVSAAKVEVEKPVAPPDPAIKEKIAAKIEATDASKMDAAFMKEIYQMDPKAAKIVGEIMTDMGAADKNAKMAELRKTMDLQVWKELLKRHNIRVENTNQGKSNGVISDLDYTLYHLAPEGGITVKDLIAEHATVWKSLHGGLSPDQLDIKIMNGDEFYPDWRNERLGSAEHQVKVREVLGQLRDNKGTYSAEGGNKQQVQNRALRDGITEVLQYDPLLDKPDIPIEQQLVRERGLTRDVAVRYKDVHPLYNHMNALGTLLQNKSEFFSHSGDRVGDAQKRAKYFNRVINEGLGHLRFFANDYMKIWESTLPNRDEMRLEYLRKTLGALKDDTGKPILDKAGLEKFRDIVDISMEIERDKIANKAGASYTDKRAGYFAKYLTEADANVTKETAGQEVAPEERGKLVIAEQERLFEIDQKHVMAEAILAGLRHSVARDLTPQGAVRNRVRFDPATQKFVLNDADAAKKIAFERATEVALFFEFVNGLPDHMQALKENLKKRAFSTAPNDDVARFYQALDGVTKAEIDRFIAGEAGNKVQGAIDQLVKTQNSRALELLLDRKQAAIDKAKKLGIVVDPKMIEAGLVREHILNARMWTLSPYRRILFKAAVDAVGTKLSGDFKNAFYGNASGLMMGSSAINLIRAIQSGDPSAIGYAAFSEAINYMPDYIQTPFTVVDLLGKVQRGDYRGAVWQGGLFVAMMKWPGLGNAMLGYNIASGSLDIVHTHFVNRIDVDLVEQALKSRPRDENGNPLRDGVRARASRFADAKESVYNGSGPGFPLFYGRFKNTKGLPVDPIIIDDEKYSIGVLPQDNLSDLQLADTAAAEFAPEIVRLLTEANLPVGSPEWKLKLGELKLKFGFEIPFYRRIAKAYTEKYKYITFYDNFPSPYNPKYLDECRLDVYDWFVQQPPGYKLELAGDAQFWFGDQTAKMQEMIARQCALILGGIRELDDQAGEASRKSMKTFAAAMEKGFNAEHALMAANAALVNRIRADEEKAARLLDQKALAQAEQHKTQFSVSYPFTFATEESPPALQFDTRMLPTAVKQPAHVEVKEEIVGLREGAPSGWVPGKDFADRFKPDAEGWIAQRPITADMRFTARLLGDDGKEAAQATLDLPVVLYQPTFSGNIGVSVYAMGAKGDSSLYSGAEVTIDKDTRITQSETGSVGFGRLKAGAQSIKVTPRKGDERHGPGAGSATLVDGVLAKDGKGVEYVSVTVKLTYIPEPKVADDKKDDTKGGAGGGKDGNKPGDKPGDKGADGGDKPGNKDDKADKGPSVEELTKTLGPATAKSAKARDAAKAACNYQSAVNAQVELVAAIRAALASSYPNGAPAEAEKLADAAEAELAQLKKAAAAQASALEYLAEARKQVKARHGDPALQALDAAANLPDLPACTGKQITALAGEIKADIGKRILLIDKAVDAANNQCDFAAAQAFGEQVAAEDPTLAWVTGELPRIRRLNERQKNARALAKDAEAKGQQADQAAAGGDVDQARVLYDAAIELGRQALEMAPACEKDNLSGLGNLAGRKAALSKPAKQTPPVKVGGGLPVDIVPGDISSGTGQVKVIQYFVFLLTGASNGLHIGQEDGLKNTIRCGYVGGGIDCKPTDHITYRKLLGPFATEGEAMVALCGTITETRIFPIGIGLKGRWQGGATWYGLWEPSVRDVTGCPKK